jgi:NADP-dependent 3-hydroxy acid dehydrogenase YdfG
MLRVDTERRFSPFKNRGLAPSNVSNVFDLLEGWVDQVLTEDEEVVVRAGSFAKALKMKDHDGARGASATVGNFSVHLREKVAHPSLTSAR